MPTAPGYADISVQHVLTGMSRPAYVTFGCNPTDTDPIAVAANVIAAFNTAGGYKTVIPTTVTLTKVRVSLGTDGSADIANEFSMSIAGTGAGSRPSANCALLVHKNTARGGRRGRGRMFIPWAVSETSVDEAGQILSASVTTLQTAMNVHFTALQTNLVPMVLLHETGVTAPGAPDVVTSLRVDSLISTQRRRLGR